MPDPTASSPDWSRDGGSGPTPGRLTLRERDELIRPPDAPGDEAIVPNDRQFGNAIPRRPHLSPMSRRNSSESGNYGVSLHHLSRRAPRVVSGRISGTPTIASRPDTRKRVMRF